MPLTTPDYIPSFMEVSAGSVERKGVYQDWSASEFLVIFPIAIT
jgi:hypothetical protein